MSVLVVTGPLPSPSHAARCEGSTPPLESNLYIQPQVGVNALLAFEREEGFEPAQGSVRLLTPSKLLSAEGGFWRVDATDESGMPTAVQWRLSCSGISAGGDEDELVPQGSLYCNALLTVRADGGITLGDGRLTVRCARLLLMHFEPCHRHRWFPIRASCMANLGIFLMNHTIVEHMFCLPSPKSLFGCAYR